MSTCYKIILPFFIAGSITFTASAQQNFWTFHTPNDKIISDKAVARKSFPEFFKLANLNIEPLRLELHAITDNQNRHSTIITLPDADGNFEQFEIVEASNFDPVLQARFPEIRAFSGKGITDNTATLKLSISPMGIQTMIFRSNRENEFIEAYSQDHTVYAVFKSQRKSGQLPWTCTTVDKSIFSELKTDISKTYGVESNTGQLKTMRLAQSCNAEYSNYFGAFNSSQVGLVLAAFNATLTRCNGVYEKDLALHLNLIANTVNVIYYSKNSDPYSNNMGLWNNQLQTTLTNVIGEDNYDIGHMFGASGGGGNAGCIGCVCVDGQKGRGITSPADGIPQGDNFDIDYVVHEVGHQLGANHSFSYSNENTGQNKEIGAGITIMGYAGITNYDPAPHSIAIFHATSIEQIQTNLNTKSCPVTTNISLNNATPIVSPVSNFTIPISTPFALTGSATDANPGDVLTYCWEQNDNGNGQTSTNSVAYATKASGPNWLSFSPTTSQVRYFPKLSTILAGLLITPPMTGGDAICNIEALSSVSRTLNFRLTIRDNSVYSSTPPIKVGQTAYTDMAVTVTNTSGPFQVTIPNTSGISWSSGSSQTITWDVNNTTVSPVSCSNVKISLSTDGGNTFSTVIVASTPNDGTETITVPAIPSTTCRIKIEAVGNIFFDISNANFTITDSGVVPPINDNAPGAILVTIGSGCSGSPFTNSGATQSVGEPFAACKGIAGYKTVWYKFTAPSSGNVRISTDYNGGTMGADSRLALFSAEDVNNYATFSNLACDDDNGSTVASRSVLYATSLTPGNTYYIQVDGKDGSTIAGTFCLSVDEMTSSMIATSTACAIGQSLVSVNDNYTGWLSVTDITGKLIALISNPAGGASTSTSTYGNALNINASTVRQDPNGTFYIDRNYLINNPSVSNLIVLFFLLNSELTALQAVDPGVTLANLQVTRQIGSTCDNDFVSANGANSSIAQTSNGLGTGFSWIQIQTPGLSKFFLHTKRAFVPLKTFLQGAYDTILTRHKNVTTAWRNILNANATAQPYNFSPINYAGTESVSSGFFTSTSATTDIVDWVLVELRNSGSPSTVVDRKAAFIREDGLIKDLDGVSDLSFRTVANGNYHVAILHRNHMGIRTANAITLNGTLGTVNTPKNFSAGGQAYVNGSFSNPPMKQANIIGTPVFVQWGANGVADATVRATGSPAANDYIFLVSTTMGGNVSLIISNVYSRADYNLDGSVRATGAPVSNDYLCLITTVLGGNSALVLNQHL